jgi:hypothetical protein
VSFVLIWVPFLLNVASDFLDRMDTNCWALLWYTWEVTKGLSSPKYLLLRQGVIILYDNGGPHTANRMCDWLCYCSWEVGQCRLDLASSDSNLFGPHKKHLAGKEIATDADVEQPVAGGLLMFNTDLFYAVIQGIGGGGVRLNA